MLTVGKGERTWSMALRSGLAFIVPAGIVNLLGHEREMFLVLSGAYAILFGTGAYRTRARTVSVVALVLVGSAAGAAAIGWAVSERNPAVSPANWSWLVPVLALSLYAALACFVVTAIRLRAGAATFPVMVTGGSLLAYQSGFTVAQVTGWALLGAASALVFSIVGWLVDPTSPQRGAVRSAVQAVAAYRRAVDSGASTVHERHRAAVACQDAWLALAGAGVIRGGRVTGRRRRFGGLARLVRDRRTTDGSRPIRGATDGPRPIRGAEERYVAVLIGTQTRLRETILRERASDPEHDLPEHEEPELPHGEPSIIPMADPPYRYQLRRAGTRVTRPLVTATRVLAASLLAGGLSLAFGLGRADWAVVTVVIMLGMGPSQRLGTIKGIHRSLGTVGGLFLFLAIWTIQPSPWLLVLVLGACQASVELLIQKNYALAVIFTTPLALVTGGAIHQNATPTITHRLLEVLIAVVVSLICLWCVLPRGSRGVFLSAARLAHHGAGDLLRRLPGRAPADLLTDREILRYELVGAARAAVDAAHDAPDWMGRRWPAHDAGQRNGFLALALSAAADPGRPMPAAAVAATRREWERLPDPSIT